MSINFPQETFLLLEAIKTHINIHQYDIDRLWSRVNQIPDAQVGVPMGGPANPEFFSFPFDLGLAVGGDGGGGSGDPNFEIAITKEFLYKGGTGDVDIKRWNGTAYAVNGSSLEDVASPLWEVPAGKNVAVMKNKADGKWAVIAREC